LRELFALAVGGTDRVTDKKRRKKRGTVPEKRRRGIRAGEMSNQRDNDLGNADEGTGRRKNLGAKSFCQGGKIPNKRGPKRKKK